MLDNQSTVRDRKYLWLLGACFVLGAAIRVFFAACYRFSVNSDYGIVALMVKHIVEGHDFPVFYYGQPYMGSLEPMFSALLCKLFGLSTFNVCLGTACLGVLLLPVIYAWGRDAGGRVAGLAAMAFTIVGPLGYLRFLAMPWGGYALTLLLGALIMWLGSRLAVRELRKDDGLVWWYALLGLLSGVGWWTNSLIGAALLTVALVLLAALRQRLFGAWRVLVGLAGFLIGSLPWWIWNARNSWESLDIMGGLGRTSAGAGLKLLLFDRVPDLLDLVHLPAWACLVGLIGVGVLVLFGVWSLFEGLRRRAVPDSGVVALATVLLFIAVSAGFFCHSVFATYDTSRYLLPLIPALAVLVGVASARLVSRARYGLGWVPLALLVGFQVWNARFVPGMLRNRTWEITSQVLNRVLAGSKIEAIYCNYSDHWLNAATGEAQCFVDIIGERYRPYAWRAELARHIAFLDNIGDVAEFITNSGGSARCEALMQFQFFHDLHPPAPCSLISAAHWKSVEDAQGSNVLLAVSDGNVQTDWQAPVLAGSTDADGAGAWIEIVFNSPVTAQGVRFLSANGEYPPAWMVEGIIADEQALSGDVPGWQPLTPLMRINCYFWSGSRLYWNGIAFRPECRFAPAKVSRLRVRFEAPEREGEVYVAELTVFGGNLQPAALSESEALDSMLAVLNARGIKRLYSDRWLANEVAQASSNSIFTLREPAIFDRHSGTPCRDRDRRLTALRLDCQAAVIVRAEEAPISRQSFKNSAIEPRETPIGPWVLFDFIPSLSDSGPGRWQAGYAEDYGLVWTGFNVLTGSR